MQSEFVFTSESVTMGHPDKLCDQISDAVVGHFLRQDPEAQVVAECALSTGVVFLSVKFRSDAAVSAGDIARDVIRRVGYEEDGFNAKSCAIITSLSESPKEPGLPRGREAAAREQASLFGFACDHTPELMPMPIVVAHRLARQLDVARQQQLPYLAPDGKVQVAIEYRRRRPYRVHGITLLASQRRGDQRASKLESDLRELVIPAAFASSDGPRPDSSTRIAVNPDGPIVGGGPALHAGLTGRKTAVDTYGEFSRHSGAALSGKHLGRIDRLGAYAARWAARNAVAAGLAELCEIQLSYSVGLPGPVSVQVETYGTAAIAEDELMHRVVHAFDFRPSAILEALEIVPWACRDAGTLPRLAVYGHFGRDDLDLPWERSDRVSALR